MAGGIQIPFALRRPWLLARDLVMKRARPDIRALESVSGAESFVWRILPHAARTFSACIALLPARLARAAAVAYLYCRTLDTYEDLIADREERERCLAAFRDRFGPVENGGLPAEAPPIEETLARDPRDRTHVVLVNRCRLVDEVFVGLAEPIRGIIVELACGMADGMIWSSDAFERQGGALADGDQLSRYCRNVLGLPTLFAVRLLRLHHSGRSSVTDDEREDAMLAGELIQLANITRDIEKDLRRGISYHPALAGDLGREDLEDPALRERIRTVREELLVRALSLAPAYTRMAEAVPFARLSLGRASTVLMLLFTDRYYRSCARRVDRRPWAGKRSGAGLILSSLPSIWSPRSATRILRSIEGRFLLAAGEG